MKLWAIEYTTGALPTSSQHRSVRRNWHVTRAAAIHDRRVMRDEGVIGRHEGVIGPVTFSLRRADLAKFLNTLEKTTPFDDDASAPPTDSAVSAKASG